MVNIEIPAKLEEEIKQRQQKEYCEKLLVGIDQKIINAYVKRRKVKTVQVVEGQAASVAAQVIEEQAAPVSTQVAQVIEEPGLNQVKVAFRTELNRRNDAYLGTVGYDPARFSPATRSRPTAGLIDPHGRFVETIQQFALLLEYCNEIKSVQHQGGDQILMIKIPSQYVGKVAYVQRQDIPQSVFDAGRVISLRREKDNQYMSIVPSLDAIRTDQPFGELSAEQVNQKYGWLSVKIKENSLVSWMVGPDIRANPPTSPGEEWALLGPHKRKK